MKFSAVLIFIFLFSFAVFAQKKAEVTVMSTHVRAQPDQKSERVVTVERGAIVVLEKKREMNGWFYVAISEGVKGWIRKDTIRFIEAEEKPAKVEKPKAEKPEKAVKISPKPKAEILPKVSEVKSKSAENSVANTQTSAPDLPQNPPTETAVDAAPIEDDEVLKIDTEEVNLSVRVVDDRNRSVSNLNLTNFRVYEDDVLQPLTALTTTEIPMFNALVIDNSRSLRGQLPKVIEAGKIIIGANRKTDESTIVRFISSDKIEVLQDFTPNANLLNNALENMFVEGGQTAIIDAVYLAAKKVEQYQNTGKPDDPKLRALILVSDGDDRGSKYDEQALFKLLRESNVQIYAVGFTGDLSQKPEADAPSRQEKAKSFLTRLAQETGGKVYFPANIEELNKIAADISGELRTQYLISYSPTNETRDGAFRKIRVEVTDGANNSKRKAITRTGRNSLPNQ